jgi:predicted MPP superfamily phosphohydrolase
MTRATHLIIFLSIFALILVLSHWYLFARITHYLQLSGTQRRTVAIVLASFGILTLLALPLSRMLPREYAAVVAWIVFPWMGILLLMLATMLVTDIVWLLTSFLPSSQFHDPARRAVMSRGFGIAALGTTALLGGYSLWNGLRPVRIKPVSISLERLPKSLDGFRIVQITDLHIGPMIDGAWLHHIVDQVNALKPDLIAVTGDLVDGSIEELGKHTAPLANLSAPHGVFFITGNHEYYSGADAWCAHVAQMGIRVLRNERVSIKAGPSGESFDLVGVDDWGSREFPGQGPNLAKALEGRDLDKMVVLLAHQPAAVNEAADYGVDLQLSGHTHGGQIWPFTYLVYLQQPYVEGLYRHHDTKTQIYVSPGTGYWGPPMRFGTYAEITDITLKASSRTAMGSLHQVG